MEEITTLQIAHMIAQIRAKQLATKDRQDRMQTNIVSFLDEHPEISVKQLEAQIKKNIEQFYEISEEINDYLKLQETAKEVGYPIKCHKTSVQLAMAKEWLENQEENLIEQIKKGEFYHQLPNTISSDQLPVIQSFSETTYWGNENPSVSSIVLASVIAVLNKEFGASIPMNVLGEATFYSFRNKEFNWTSRMIEKINNQKYSFANAEGGMPLYGEYQYGGQRDFGENQQVLAPEDCSSSVGKATYLTTEQVNHMSIRNMVDPYQDNYKIITVFNKGEQIRDDQLALIEPGDICLVKGTHTSLVATKPDSMKNITTVQFNRDIDCQKNKLLGGGSYNYNLPEKTEKMDITILKPYLLKPLRESCSLSSLLNQIDNNYKEIFSNGPTSRLGDCKIFLPSNGPASLLDEKCDENVPRSAPPRLSLNP